MKLHKYYIIVSVKTNRVVHSTTSEAESMAYFNTLKGGEYFAEVRYS